MSDSIEKYVEALRSSLKEIDRLRKQNEQLATAKVEPVAIVGIGCRFPGGVSSPSDLWDVLVGGVDAISGFPVDRGWDLTDGGSGKGGFLHDAAEFDAGFFGISPREALAMDPQQRLLLETAWEALERARIDPHSLKGSKTGVYAGLMYHDYSEPLRAAADEVGGILGIGTAGSVLSGRVAYTLGLEGPAVTVDTACSSSLVALHLAAQALRSGECDLALAGGVTVMATPGAFAEQGGVARDGRCKSFAASADGTGWAEGSALVVVERLSDAQRNGHRVLAVVRGSAINQDGASNGLTAPNGPSQQRVIRQALASAGLTAAEVDVVEAHGTGTRLGDPIEAQALLATYGQGRPEGRPLWLGSLKSNIGHTQGAAGVGGVIKMVLAMQHGQLPRTLHVGEPTPEVDWSSGAVELLTEQRSWPVVDRPWRAGVSSFGVSGTNAHVILEQAPEFEPAARVEAVPSVVPWVLSARSESALREQARRLLAHVEADPGLDPVDVGAALVSTRASLEHRAVVLGAGRDELIAGLAGLVAGEPGAGVVAGQGAAGGRGVVFVFPGQGSQWVGMARGLLVASPVFAERMGECARALAPFVDWDLLEALGDQEALGRVDVVQPVLWAVMVSLAQVWRSLGVTPAAVVGHSQGEIAAACVAGGLSLADAARISAVRSRMIAGSLAGRGGMVSVGLPRAEVESLIVRWEGRLSVAAVNGPSSVVVSGDPEALAELVVAGGAEDFRARRVEVDYASHSAHVEEIEAELVEALADIAPVEGSVAFYSTVTGELTDTRDLDAEYWYRNLRETVRLADITRALATAGHGTFVEVSPHPVLTPSLEETLFESHPAAVVTGTLRRSENDPEQLLVAAARLHTRGVPVDWAAIVGQGPAIELPTYAFQRERYWPEAVSEPVVGADDELWSVVEGSDVGLLSAELEVGERALGEVVPALVAWRERRRAGSVVEGWRFAEGWKLLPGVSGGVLSGGWLVVVPVGWGEDAWVAGVVGALGAGVVRLEVAGDTDRAELAGRLADLPVPAGVVSLLGVAEQACAGFGATPVGLAGTVGLVQALGDCGIAARVWCVTRGAVSVGSGDLLVSPVQSALWGLGRSVALDLPGRWGGLVDLPAVLDGQTGGLLRRVLTGDEDQVAVRGSGVYGRRLVRAGGTGAAGAGVRLSGSVLITGGTGGLGGHVARWAVARGAEHVVLVSRRGEQAPGASGLREELIALGARVTVEACDVADREALAAVLGAIPGECPLTAVVHAAGIGDHHAPVEGLEVERLDAVLRAKMVSAWHLHELTAGLDLTAFVLFSSGAASWGAGGQAAYAAANAFLDGLAGYRHGAGLAATSVAWGLWAGPGMGAADVESVEGYRRRGVLAMEPELAMAALEGAVCDGSVTLTVTNTDWETFAPSFTVERPSALLSGIPEARKALALPGAGTGGESALRRRLAGLGERERTRALLDLVRREAAVTLGFDNADALPQGRAFRDVGFDSLTAVELRNKLASATGLVLPASLVFDYPTPVALAEHLGAELLGTVEAVSVMPVTTVAVDEPIAIVGMGCRFPGGLSSPEQLWDAVVSSVDAMSEFPADRGWDLVGDGFARVGGFVEDMAGFDAGFFGISPREALAMDPQQRLLLETAWEALERSGIDPNALKGSRTGVFVGGAVSGYETVGNVSDEADGYRITGGASSVLSGRIAYVLGLEGPAVTVDTACSSSLVALHWAAQALRSGECDLALTGGVAVMATPGAFAEFATQGVLAGDGRCKSFAASADGTGWGEGAGLLVVERLSDARRNGHRVLAVVRGSAINQDGASNGLSAPNGPSQQRVIRQALASAGLTTAEVDVVEAHGTGTRLGDPIEAQALLATYGQDRPEDRPLWLGSLKSNIGHTQAAAGVAGVIKMVLAMQHGQLPRTLHVDEPTPEVDWSAGAVELLTEQQPWPMVDRPWRAGVSSFGVSGTNAHVILEQAPELEPASRLEAEPVVVPWVLSAKSESALRDQARRLAAHVEADPELDPVDVGAALVSTRAGLEHRAVVLGTDRDELIARLTGLATGEPGAGVVTGVAGQSTTGGRDVVFVFPGQGAQWAGMAQELLAASPVFAERMRECAQALAPFVEWDLLEALENQEALARVEVVQPVLWAVMVSLAHVWQSLGVTPAAVMGHSQGEIAAACVAGGLSLTDAARIIAVRSRLLAESLAGRGGMVSVRLPRAEAESLIARWEGRLSIAAVNGPSWVVVSGDAEAVTELVVAGEAEDFRTRRMDTDCAGHSPQVDEIRDELVEALADIAPMEGTVAFYSTVTGELTDTRELDAEYWYRNARETVRLAETTPVLATAGYEMFVEVSPHPVLTPSLEETLFESHPAAVVTGTLRRGENEPEQLLTALSTLHTHGVPVDWSAVVGQDSTVELPTYAFQHQRYWPRPRVVAGDARGMGLTSVGHPLLGAAVELAGDEGVVFTSRLSLASHAWLADHMARGVVLLAGTVFVELVVRAGDEVGCGVLEDLALERPLVLSERGAVQVQVVVEAPAESGRRAVSVYSRPEEEVGWTRHASGTLASESTMPTGAELAVWPPAGAEPVPVDGFYEALAETGYGYGPAFQGVRAVWRRGEEVFAEVRLSGEVAERAGEFGIHPALFDAALHAAAFLPAGGEGGLPFSWSGVALHASGARSLRVRLSETEDGGLCLNAADDTGAPVLSVDSLTLRPLRAELLESGAEQRSLFSVDWILKPAVPTGAENSPRCVVAGAGGQDLAKTLGVAWYPELSECPETDLVLLPAGAGADDGDVVAAVRSEVCRVLELVQQWVADERGDARLVVVTRNAVSTGTGDRVEDVAGVQGLVRSARSEHPGRFGLVDVDGSAESWQCLPAVLSGTADDEDGFELAVRAGQAYAPRLTPAHTREVLTLPMETWRLGMAGQGSVDDLVIVPSPEAEVPLEAGQVRIGVRAAGLNFRDVLNVLGVYPGEAPVLGAEVAGVVLETGPGVTGFVPGDRVMGMAVGGFGPVVMADARLIAPIPQGWSFAQAAGVPVVFLTAWYGLRETGRLAAGQRVLVHAAAGGVGMAAVQLARLWGAEVFATASEGKQDTVCGLGVARDHIASSRTTEFAGRFTGMDVVLNSLAGEFVDASLGVLRDGGRFVELGKTDIRDTDAIATTHPEVSYHAIDLEIDLDVVGGMLAELAELFEAGVLSPLPTRAWDVRQGRDAFRYMAQARHVGKIVLTVPQQLDPEGTVLITGGTGGLGGLLARHLADRHGIRHLTLVSRQGIAAPGARELAGELTALGAEVRVVACDVSDRNAVAELVAGVPQERPLTAVIHAAAVLDDGTITSLTPERIDTVMRPKADAAWYLHEATAGLDLAAFILFSSFSATSGAPGQGNYAAANAFLDALALHRHVQGLPAASLAWGWWADTNSMTGLGHTDHARFGRAGVRAMPAAEGLALFDLACRRPEAYLVPVGLELPRNGGSVPPLLRGLVAGGPARPVARAGDQDGSGLVRRLAGLTAADQQRLLRDLVCGHVATVLGHASVEAVDPEKALRDMGFDSLTTVELRNRLAAATGLRLPATLAFDHPTVSRLATHLRQQLLGTVEAVPMTPVTTVAVDEPIAIVGMGCRFPGGVESPEQLWALLTGGVDTISAFPTQRGWDLAGDGATQTGGFLKDVAGFDAGFFGISPREALVMDPQQRLLLETAWEALERSGIDPNALKGSRTGVFVGGTGSGYDTVGDAADQVDGYLLTGAASSVLSGRIAYTLGLEGPAVTVDTACSSSLVALHLAAQALRSGECSMALAGGVTVMATPGVFIAGSAMQGGVGGDGRCKAFSATADGFGVAEGAGLLVVERLSDARRNGHRVLAVVRGSAINQDGASNGLTAPNGPSQQRVIRQALASAGVTTTEVDVVEAHGTGTRLGDPIEAQALLATYGQDRPEDRPLWLGSVKSNLGHTQAAAGVAGVIKMVLAMQHGQLPRTLHVDEPTPEVDWSAGAVELLTEQQPWPVVDRPWRAGVSSFGISGTNAHVILEQAPELEPASDAVVSPSVVPWVLSARSESALRDQARRLLAHVEADPGLDPVDVGAALVSTRAGFGHRAVVLGTDRDELMRGLRGLAAGEAGTGAVTGDGAGGAGRVVFLFAGQGPGSIAWCVRTARELAAEFPVFAEAFDEVRAQFAEWLPGSLEPVATDDELVDPGWARAALFAFEVAMFRLLSSWGVTPDYVAGHSTGEAVAAYVAGAWSLDDARRVVTAGDDGNGQPAAGSPVPRSSRIVLVSLESGEPVRERPEFAVADTERPARFAEAVGWLREQGATRFVELGPDAALTGLRPDGVDAEFVAMQRQDRPQVYEAMAALAFLYTRGVTVDWRAMFARSGARRVELPTYAFQRERFWSLASGTGGVAGAGLSAAGHALLGAVVRLADRDELVFTSRLSQATYPWLADHRLGATAVLPVTALVDIAMRAGDEAGCPVLEELTVHAPLVVPDHGAVQVQVVVGSPDEEGRRPIAVYSRPENTDDEWLSYATGLLAALGGEPGWTERTWPPADARPVPVEDAYDMLAERGYRYGPVFQGLRAVWRRAGVVFAEVALPQRATGESARFGVHPALLDAALHPLLIASEDIRLPSTWTNVSLHTTGTTALRVALTPAGDGDGYRLDVADEVGNTVATAQISRWERVSTEALAGKRSDEDDLLRVEWTPAGALENTGEHEDSVALLGEVSGELSEAGFLRFGDITEAALSYEPWDILVAESPADGELPSVAHRAVRHVLTRLQEWVTRDDLPDNRLVVVTRGAVAASEGEAVVDLAGAAVWGLVRSAQSEHPDRITLVDIPDGGSVPWARIAAAAAIEPQLAVRDGELLVPRLVRTTGGGTVRPAPAGRGTVLVTGGTGALGALFARHLVTRHGVRHLVLASRRGAEAPQADVLRETLAELGAQVEFVACDVADRESVAQLLAGIGEEHPLVGVVHAAGALDDGVVTSLTGERVTEVLRPKADGAWHLHELTQHLDLDLFVLFSSVSGVLGIPGQANYAAANAFLDGLAEHRRARALPAVSLAWGLFDDTAAAAKQLGLRPITTETAVRLFDQALPDGPAAVVPAPLDLGRLGQEAVRVPALLRSLLPARATRGTGAEAGAEESLTERLAGMPRSEAEQYVRDLVRRETATALGYASAGEVAPEVSFRDAGFDSLAAVRFRNQLVDKTGLALPTTLVFDHTSPAVLADHLVGRLVVTGESPEQAVLAELDRLEAVLMSLPAGPGADGHPETEAIASRLDAVVSRWRTAFRPSGTDDHAETVTRLQDATEEEVLDFIDRQFRRDER